jgi:hypothetical protein
MRGLPPSSGSAELADSDSRTRCGLAALRALTMMVLTNAEGTSDAAGVALRQTAMHLIGNVDAGCLSRLTWHSRQSP